MSRFLTIGAAQLGPVSRDEPRERVVERMLALLRDANAHGCELVVFPELALTTFFPRWYEADRADAEHWFETEMPGPATKALFDEALQLGVGFCLGYAEATPPDSDGVVHHYNSQVLVERD